MWKLEKRSKGLLLSLIVFLLITVPACSPLLGQTPTPVPSLTVTPSPTTQLNAINPDWTPPQLGTQALDPDLSNIVAQVKPAVVAIDVTIPASGPFNPVPEEGAGSGWIIDSNGYIVTNAHVVSGASNISITLDDGRVFTAEQVLEDEISDLAVIKINATGLPTVKLGNSSKLKIGMRVLAIGNALGLGISMTGGYVSRLGVSITLSSQESFYDLIETDAAINPGNSGGPLVDMLGEVIGITNAKYVALEVQSVGYAIPSAQAISAITDLITRGYVTRPYIGVSLQTVTPSLALLRGLPVEKGALITEIDPGAPAGQAGLQAGDIIVKIADQDVSNASEAARLIRTSQIGQRLTINYYRGQTQASINVIPVQASPPS